MRKILFLITVILLAATALGFYAVRYGKITLPRDEEVEPAPNFSLKDYGGKTVSLSDFDGAPLVLNAWAAWCPFCKQELPDFAQAQKEFGNEIVIIAIDRAESLETAKKYSDELGVTDKLVFLLDPTDSFYRSIGGFSMPETIFVDREGNTIFHKRGPMDINEIRIRIKNLIDA